MPGKVFISYSHKDRKAKDELRTHLNAVVMAGMLDVWDDQRIGVGRNWEAEIEQALDECVAAILLISPNFLASTFINRVEVPKLLMRRQKEGLQIFPIVWSACVWNVVDWLPTMNLFPPGGKPLRGLPAHRRDEHFAALTEVILDLVRDDEAPTREEGRGNGQTLNPPDAWSSAEAILDHDVARSSDPAQASAPVDWEQVTKGLRAVMVSEKTDGPTLAGPAADPAEQTAPPVAEDSALGLEPVATEATSNFIVDAIEPEPPRIPFVEIDETRIKINAPVLHGVSDGWFTPGNGAVEWFQDHARAPEMVAVPAGRGLMGSPGDDPDVENDEMPQHEVAIDAHFAIGRHPVTFEEFDLFCQEVGRDLPGDENWGRGRRPVINVSWEDAHAYIAWLNGSASGDAARPYRLPSEAEWEYACRAGGSSIYSFGDTASDLANYAWYSNVSNDQTHPVGEKRPNGFGLYDMHGNVREWVEDPWHDDYSGAPGDGSVWTDGGEDAYRVVRGGCYFSNPDALRSATRYGVRPDDRRRHLGFRVARVLVP